MRCRSIVCYRVASFSRDVIIKSRKKGERAVPRATKGTWEDIHISRCLGVEEGPLLTQIYAKKGHVAFLLMSCLLGVYG